MINIVTANFVSGFMEFTLFGIFMILSPASLILLVRRHQSGSSAPTVKIRKGLAFAWKLRKSPLIVANVLFILTISIHFVFSADRLVAAVIMHDGGAPTVAFLTDLRERTQVARLVLLVIDMFLGDVVITYRVWLVWGQSLLITLFPILTVIGVIVAGSGMIHEFTVSTSDTGVFTASVGPWITATCVMTVWYSVVKTQFTDTVVVVIAWRIWQTNRLLKNTGVLETGRSLLEGMAIFVESAALWTTWVIIYLIWYLTGSPLEAIGSGTAPAVLGITFTLITVRVGLGIAQETRPSTTSMRWAIPRTSRSRRSETGSHLPQTIKLTVTQTQTAEHDQNENGGECSMGDRGAQKSKRLGTDSPQRSDMFEGDV
ncbi:hypothetical protein C8Q80DRAFT_1096103 [Daedaleopsis nitida]|nr:hypothetical protein C8Q80DRAFT_1096103 [Daedaleopsis nitida]